MERSNLIKLLISTIIFLIVWLLPTTAFGVEGLTVIEQRVIAIFVLAAVLWSMEPIPIWGTSVVIMVMMLLTTSDSMLSFFNDNLSIQEIARKLGISESSEALTKEAVTNAMKGYTFYDGVKTPILGAKSIMASFADPTVMLFMGGFVLAIAATKYKLDATLARTILKPFGKRPKFVMLGFLVVTALLSMFMSNTATAAMMIAILTPVLASMPESDNAGRVGLALSIPVAANIGGIGSPIGTPPNVVAVGNLAKEGIDISFGNWMMIMVPVAMIILFLAWLFLNRKFPCKQESIEIKIDGEVDKSPKAKIVYVTFAVTILLWVFGKELLGVNANTVAMIPFAVFCITGVFEKKDLAKIDWDVLWLVAGGFALGVGLDAKIGPDGLTMSKHIVGAIPFDSWPTLAIILGSGVLCIVMSTFMSNSATAALLIPIFVALGKGMSDQLEPYGGVVTLIVGLALSASFAMSLPISTPPNAIAYSKGFIKQKDMVLVGVVVGVISLVISYTVLFFMGGLLK